MATDTELPDDRAELSLLIHAYVDDELDPVNALAIERRIAGDPTAAAEYARITTLRQVLRDKFPREALPPLLMARINRAIGATQRRSPPPWTLMAASILVSLAVGSGSTFLVLDRAPHGAGVAEEAIAGHMRALMAPSTIDVKSSERHTVKPWFNGRVPVSPRVVDLANDGFPLAGGRIDVFGTTPVPTLVYTRRLHVISLYAVPATTSPATAPGAVNGFNIVTWSDGATIYYAVSDLNPTELQSFAQLFRSAPG